MVRVSPVHNNELSRLILQTYEGSQAAYEKQKPSWKLCSTTERFTDRPVRGKESDFAVFVRLPCVSIRREPLILMNASSFHIFIGRRLVAGRLWPELYERSRTRPGTSTHGKRPSKTSSTQGGSGSVVRPCTRLELTLQQEKQAWRVPPSSREAMGSHGYGGE